MCTVSVIRPLVTQSLEGAPRALIIRVVVNRDEQRQRPEALAPIVVHGGRMRAVMPVDPQGRGTWVAANEAGLVFALLNGPASPVELVGVSSPSRGSIIPKLLEATTIDEAWDRLSRLDLSPYRPCRIIVASAAGMLDAERLPGGRLRHRKIFLPLRFLAASSSLDHAGACEARGALFREMAPMDAATQDAFHAHQWPERPELSVRMSRPEACTVSRTVVEVRDTGVTMIYAPTAGPTHALTMTSVTARNARAADRGAA